MSGWSGGSGLFFVLFFEMQKGPMWVIFYHLFVIVRRFLELGGHFFGDFGVLGSSLDVFGAGGVQGGDLVEIRRSIGPLFALFWTIFLV